MQGEIPIKLQLHKHLRSSFKAKKLTLMTAFLSLEDKRIFSGFKSL